MNIRDYYSGMSRLYIHQSILCVIVFLVVVFPALQITSFFPTNTAGILLFVMLIYYALRHIYFAYKSHKLPNPAIFRNEGEVLLMLAPSPVTAYQGKLFTGSGFCAFSIKKGRKVKDQLFTVTDHRKNTYWLVQMNALGMQLLEAGKKNPLRMLKSEKREYRTTDGQYYRIVKSVYTFSIKKNGKKIMSVSQGLMPISMQRIFSASTPIIKFDRQINEEERIFCLVLYFTN
ncbi:hypothetical protein [Bacillus sp. SD088]|uniref:hypothetical protein n=1 Tax=Bacillus sp. SD088 TaxID=2782012 RepID=UPI001A97CB15|nr:hypothetical protein [Bacillus sp. SD088]MBO0995152.1 hypothetical protein [Bacillus sp. SD088]